MPNRGRDIAGVVVGKFDDKRRLERRSSLEINAELTEDFPCQRNNPAISDTEGLNRCRARIFPPVDYNPFAGVEFIYSRIIACVFPYRFIFGKFCAGRFPDAARNSVCCAESSKSSLIVVVCHVRHTSAATIRATLRVCAKGRRSVGRCWTLILLMSPEQPLESIATNPAPAIR